MKIANARTPIMSITMTNADAQGNDEPPAEIGTRMKTVATRLVKDPRKSTFLSFDLNDPEIGLRGRKKKIWTSEKQLTGTVIQNTHRH
jgi:hypothetical protein